MSRAKNQKKTKRERNFSLCLFACKYHRRNTVRGSNVYMSGKKKDKAAIRKFIVTPVSKFDVLGKYGQIEKSHKMKNLWFCPRRKKYFPKKGMKFPTHKIILINPVVTAYLESTSMVKTLKSLGVKDGDLSKASYKYHSMMKKFANHTAYVKTLVTFLFYFPYCLSNLTATVKDPVGYICRLFDGERYKNDKANMRRMFISIMRKMGLVFHVDANGVVWKVASSFLIKKFSRYMHFRTHSIFYFSSICKSGNQSTAIASHFCTHSPPICAEKVEHIKINRVNFTKNEEATQYQKYKLLKKFRTGVYIKIDELNVHQKNGKIYNLFLLIGTRLIRNVSKEYDFKRLYQDCLRIIRERKTVTEKSVKEMIKYFVERIENCLRDRQR